jgi:hypothetical protein
MAQRGFQQNWRQYWRQWLGGTFIAGAVLLGGSTPSYANGELHQIYSLLNELDRAVCFNQWDQALAWTDALIATDGVTVALSEQSCHYSR